MFQGAQQRARPKQPQRSWNSCKRSNCRDKTYTTELHVSDFPSRERGWGSETSDKPQSICEDRTLQDGRSLPLPDLLQPQKWMIKMDLKDAYLQISIHPDYQHFLTF